MNALTTFIGVDLAWKSDKNHSGVIVMRGTLEGAEIIASSNGLATLSGVLEFVITHSTENTVVAIDAPLIITNQTGQRPCETLIGRRFGARDASAHTSNLKLYPNAGSVIFESMLRANGFSHQPCPSMDKQKPGKWCFEVYPHPAQIVLFNLNRIIKYKKGTIAQKKAGLEIFRGYIKRQLISGISPLRDTEVLSDLLAVDLERLSSKTLKQYEDILDATFCAYLAYFYWCWGGEKNEMIGDLQSGYIVNPTEQVCL